MAITSFITVLSRSVLSWIDEPPVVVFLQSLWNIIRGNEMQDGWSNFLIDLICILIGNLRDLRISFACSSSCPNPRPPHFDISTMCSMVQYSVSSSVTSHQQIVVGGLFQLKMWTDADNWTGGGPVLPIIRKLFPTLQSRVIKENISAKV